MDGGEGRGDEARSSSVGSDGGEGRGDEGRSSSVASDGGRPVDDAESEDGEPDDSDADDANVDPEDLRPDFSGSPGERRDYSQPAPLVDGEYAVDKHPSDHTTPDDAATADDDAEQAEPSDADDHADIDAHDAGHEGPPPGGWRRLSTAEALRGEETTWFMLGPILAAVTGAILVGIIPYELGFLELIELIVEGVLAGTEVPA
jgi:multicomponent Na+:H+ antiporter subunit D